MSLDDTLDHAFRQMKVTLPSILIDFWARMNNLFFRPELMICSVFLWQMYQSPARLICDQKVWPRKEKLSMNSSKRRN